MCRKVGISVCVPVFPCAVFVHVMDGFSYLDWLTDCCSKMLQFTLVKLNQNQAVIRAVFEYSLAQQTLGFLSAFDNTPHMLHVHVAYFKRLHEFGEFWCRTAGGRNIVAQFNVLSNLSMTDTLKMVCVSVHRAIIRCLWILHRYCSPLLVPVSFSPHHYFRTKLIYFVESCLLLLSAPSL